MRFISTKTHGALDYLTAIVLILAPWIFNFADGSAAQWVPVVLGVVLLLQSLMTDYELGFFKTISMPMHLNLDILSGIILAASPWIFGFADQVYLPHLIVGLMEIGAGMFTEREPYRGTAHTHTHA